MIMFMGGYIEIKKRTRNIKSVERLRKRNLLKIAVKRKKERKKGSIPL